MALRPAEKAIGSVRSLGSPDTEAWWQQLAEAGDAAAYCRAWLAIQCEEIERVGTALLLLADEGGSFVPAAVWPEAQADVSYLGPVAQRCLGTRTALSERGSEPHASRLFAAYPLEEAGQLFGCVVLDLPMMAAGDLPPVWRALHWGSGRIETMWLRRLLLQRAGTEQRTRNALDILSSIADQTTLDQALMQLANEIVVRYEVERVAIGIERRGRVRLAAVSNSAWFEPNAAFSVALENAMEEACDQSRTVTYPAGEPPSGALSVAHRDLAGAGGACSVPLTLRHRAFGAITCLTVGPVPTEILAALEAIAALVAPQLSLRVELRQWLAGRLAEILRGFWRDCRDPQRPSFRVGVAAVLLVGLVFALARGDYRVSGQAVIEGEVQRSLAAPFEGFIDESKVRAGQRVSAGQVLATLDDRDLQNDRRKWLADREQAERKYRDALAKHDRPNARILAAQLAEANAQVALAEDKLVRAHITAPFAGVVVSGDLSQLLGTPVEKGKVLFEIAPLDAYRVILKVPENAIREVRARQTGRIVLAGISGETLPFIVKNIGVATAEDGDNVFRVEAELAESAPGLRPGMEGVGKIVIGRRHLIWIWTHSFFEWLDLKLWGWLP